MNSLQDNNQFSDFLRLASLKGLTGSRLRGRPDREFADMQNPDLLGTATPPPFLPPMPEPVPGNFDVRANQKIEPEQFQPPTNLYEGLQHLRSIPHTSSGQLQDPLEAIRARVQEDPELMGLLPEETRNLLAGSAPNPEKAFVPPSGANMPEVEAPSNLTQKQYAPLPGMNAPPPNPFASIAQLGMLNQQQPPPMGEPAMGQPVAPPQQQLNPNLPQDTQQNQPPEIGTQTQPGAINQVMSTPTLKSKIDEIFGPVDPAMAQAAESFEKAMNAYSKSLDDVTAGLNERESAIRQRIESRELTTSDKILMALALIAPAIIGGLVGGKEGLIGALGGGAKGLADVFGGRAKEGKEDEEALSGLALDKSKVAKEQAALFPTVQEFKNKLADSIPNKALREIFNRDGEVVGDKLVLKSGNPNLPIKSDAIRDVEDYKRIKKEIPKFANSLSSTEQAMKTIDSMHSLLDAANKSVNNKNMLQKGLSYLPLYDSVTGAMKAFIPYTRDTVKDPEGNEHKISELYNTLRTQLSDIWRKGQQNNANAFKATEQHFFQQLPDPFGRTSFLEGKSDINQNKKQLDLVKDKFADNIITYLDEQGIDTTPVRSILSSTVRNQELSDKERKRNRVNAAVEQSIGGK